MANPKQKQSGSDPKGQFQNTAAAQTERFNQQQGPMVQAMGFNYGRGTEANYGDYTDIMNQYRGIASGGDAADYSGGDDGGVVEVVDIHPSLLVTRTRSSSYAGYEDFSQTGGFLT